MKKADLLDEHRAAMLQCRVCGHPPEVQPIVSIARSPRVMLVGQAPGIVEAGGGAPFSGRAGVTLFRWFASVGLDERTVRSRMYIAAITRCYPGANDSGRGDRVPSVTERSNCSQWLFAELRIIKPSLIIPVGRLAIDAFLGPVPLDEVIGKQHALTNDAGPGAREAGGLSYDVRRTVVIPLAHPSGASSWIHQPGHKQLLADALQLIAERWEAIHRGRRVA
jgi:uracil-DNA glycosylase